MMDAASGFEVERLDAYAEQFESLSATIGDEVTKAIDSVSNFDISSLGISEKIDSVTSLLSDSAEKFKKSLEGMGFDLGSLGEMKLDVI